MAKASQLMNPSFLPHSAVTQALLILSSAKSRALVGGDRGRGGECLGKWLWLRGCHGDAAGCRAEVGVLQGLWGPQLHTPVVFSFPSPAPHPDACQAVLVTGWVGDRWCR